MTIATPPSDTAHVHVNGIDLYYEVHGQGPPLVLLHGGVDPAATFGATLAELARPHRVFAVHLQGHGRTRDVARPLRFETMADDVAALARHLGLGRASVMGYSLGGGVALQLAIRHPTLVERLVVVSAPFSRDGFFPEVNAAFERMPADASVIAASVRQSPLAATYPEVEWEALFRKLGELNAQPRDWSAGVARIAAPTLLVFADADAVRPEHVSEFYRLLGGGQRDAGLDGSGRPPHQLAVIPGTTHYDLLASPAVARFAAEFLAR